jgi:TonB family protein
MPREEGPFIMSCNSTRVRLRSRLFLLIVGSIVFLLMGHLQQLDAQKLSRPSSVAQPSSDWDRYALKDGEFSVLLPTVPAMSTYITSSWDPSWKIHQDNVIGAYAQGVVYGIQIFEVRQSLDEFIAESGHTSGGDRTREITVSSVRGKEYSYEDDTIKRVTQFFLRGQHVYVFKAQGSRLGNPAIGIPRFFESIKFARPSVGLMIVDGPGVQESKDATPVTNSKDDGILSGKEVTRKAMVITKPEPTYTEEARQAEITGTVVLRGVFTSFGAVTNLRVMSGLPHGLTEKAVAAARQIKFIPAIKEGRLVSMYIQLEYNFNLY